MNKKTQMKIAIGISNLFLACLNYLQNEQNKLCFNYYAGVVSLTTLGIIETLERSEEEEIELVGLGQLL